MEKQENFQNLTNCLRSAIGMLELEKDSQLRIDVLSICDYLENSTFRIAVFGPFNHGKSTLLNALLGKKTLPIDLIPTTGAAIRVRYGQELYTKITLKDSKEVSEQGTNILKTYAILDEDRYMRSDVASVEVYCDHPFLKTGVELVDLPGTNDREAQDNLVRDQLLTADLIVQVLDARKLMTLGERENLRDWLLDRNIKTIVFVVNFLNLLEPEDQKEIQNRLRFVAESFRSELPTGISNLYQVDALPALRARLKGDTAAAQTTGLAAFESALQNIVAASVEKRENRLPRVIAIAQKIHQVGEEKKQAITAEIETQKQKQQAKIEIKQKAEKLIKQGFQRSISEFQSWLYLPKLLSKYGAELAIALQQGTFNTWEAGEFKQTVRENQKTITEWVKKGCEFFQIKNIEELIISFPDAPTVHIPEPPKTKTKVGWVLGGSMGAVVLGGASYIINKVSSKPETPDSFHTQLSQAYTEAAKNYLTRFSEQAFSTLNQYEQKAEKLITIQTTEQTTTHYQLQLLDSLLNNLTQEIQKFNNP